MDKEYFPEDGPLTEDPLTAAVKNHFGLSYLFPYQRLVITNILEAADAPPEEDRASLGRQIVILPTGAGKSLCFQLPAMLLSGPTLVIYPLLSLMADQERRLQDRGFSPVILRGAQSKEERAAIWEKLRTGESRFIIANPEVLLSPGVKEKLGGLGIVHTVIDEAHCVSEWGESFRPAYLRIPEIIEAAAPPLLTAFTATASAQVLEKIETYIFGGQGARRIIGSPDRANISYAAQGCILRDLAVRDLIVRSPRPAIVFCSSRPGTEKLAHYLRNELEDQEIRFYHAGLSREEKTGVEQWFFHNPLGVLVSTCAYGMGVDKADIRTVIHRDCPPSVEAYLQESGRAGRDGKQSRAILLWGPGSSPERAKNSADRRRLEELLSYSRNTGTCRRDQLLRLLNYEGSGESPEGECCDVCGGKASTLLREEETLLEFFRKNSRFYTVPEASAALAEIKTLNWTAEEAGEAIRCLLKNRQLIEIKNILWKNKLKPR